MFWCEKWFDPTENELYIASLIPKGGRKYPHCINVLFRLEFRAIDFAALSYSVVLDYFIKTSGVTHVNSAVLKRLPVLNRTTDNRIRTALWLRTLALSCVTSHYQELWELMCKQEVPQLTTFEGYHEERKLRCIEQFQSDNWTIGHNHCDSQFFKKLTPNWQRNIALRSHFDERQALIEIDVLAAIGFGN